MGGEATCEWQVHWSDGSSYEGYWKRGMPSGWGKYTWPSGNKYHGEYLAGTYYTLTSPQPWPLPFHLAHLSLYTHTQLLHVNVLHSSTLAFVP